MTQPGLNLLPTITATGATTSATDTARFYRVLFLPCQKIAARTAAW
jgi:hypothetical protein